jgi:hypothetical protein
MEPNFSAYPWQRLRSLTRAQAVLESTVAQWIGARGAGAGDAAAGERLARLIGGTLRPAVRVEVVAPSAPGSFDPFAARCEVRVGSAASRALIEVRGASLAVRAIAQRVLGGPAELAAPRPLGVVEKSLWALVVATALEDLGVAGEVWPQLDEIDDAHAPHPAASHAPHPAASHAHATRVGHVAAERSKHRGLHIHRVGPHVDEAYARGSGGSAGSAGSPGSAGSAGSLASGSAPPVVELAVTLGDIVLAVQLHGPPDLALRAAPSRSPAWLSTTLLDVPIIVGRCALARGDLDRLAVRSVVTLERAAGNAELAVLGGAVGLRVAPGAVEAEVATGYVARDMSLPDDAHVELTVALGTTQLSLRQLGDLALGQIIQLGRPLAGPFELRAAGRVVGRGELVEVDGELAVRIVSLGD